jgi:2-(1,2-epoxy-1,2-dihydrophenyl)acetyl-CoA isomerase
LRADHAIRTSAMTYKSIEFSVDTPTSVARLTLNRPDKMNAFTGDMHAELRDALDALQAGTGDSAAARVLVVTGAGRGFCAGQDLADPDMVFTPGEPPPDVGNVVERNFKPLVMRLTNLRVPTIARVQGVAAGAGCSLALACDMVVAAEAASFMLPFSKIGLIPDTGASWAVPQRLGFARAMGLALTAQKLPAAKAADWGLIWECVANDALDGAVDALAAQLAALPTTALVRTRQAMLAAHTASLEQHLSYEALMMRELGHSADYVEGVAAFLEKRPARFNQG